MVEGKVKKLEKEERRDDQYRLRLSQSERMMLEELSYKTEKSRSDILRRALKMYYNLTMRRM